MNSKQLTEDKYISLSDVCKEIIFIINIFDFIDVIVNIPVDVFVENKWYIFLSDNIVTKQSKHISTRYF